jgi:uncharacterized repeat protein (TIGR03803 family)
LFKITASGDLTTVHNFESTDGANEEGPLFEATNGKLYGTTDQGGANGYGSIYDATLAGAVTTLYSFNATGGNYPVAGVTQGTDGSLYGTTTLTSGFSTFGTTFKITTGGAFTTLHTFDNSDGQRTGARHRWELLWGHVRRWEQ